MRMCFISAFEAHDASSDAAFSLLMALEQGEFIGITSELTLAEILVKPLQLKDAELAKVYIEIFEREKSIETHPVDIAVLVEAARVRVESARTKLPDAIHIATAELARCRVFVTNDSRLQLTPSVKQVRVEAGIVEAIRAVLHA
jgi:predicted nucleic acid-binding protein